LTLYHFCLINPEDASLEIFYQRPRGGKRGTGDVLILIQGFDSTAIITQISQEKVCTAVPI
jgi:hypothetical protein